MQKETIGHDNDFQLDSKIEVELSSRKHYRDMVEYEHHLTRKRLQQLKNQGIKLIISTKKFPDAMGQICREFDMDAISSVDVDEARALSK